MPSLTIITPVLNAAHLLRGCIASSADQDCEHLFIDGGSTDGGRELLQRFGSLLIDAPGTGIYQAQNVGIEMAQGDWCYFIGADDRLRPGAVVALRQALCGGEYQYARIKMRYGLPLMPRYMPMQQSWVYRRSLLIERGGFTAPGLAELPFNRAIANLPHVRTDVAMCDVAGGGMSSREIESGVLI